MSAKVDVSPVSIVVWCTECPSFGENAFNEERGHDIAHDHERSVHPETQTALYNRLNYRKRKIVA
ncbi:hypothetical protein [Marisediminicola sp. LYQ85]|uniref:hypothetical protein n=1 Tax=Marisediminicola sp. LYQ85 TaxID=3391062 RepID=UPI003983C6AA